jgi:hypothetical protein
VHWLTVVTVALWPKAVKRRGYALAIIKRLVPTGIACSAWRRKTTHWHQWNLNATTPLSVSDESSRPKHRHTAFIRMACEPAQEGHKKTQKRSKHAVLAKCTLLASTLAKRASSSKCVPVTGHTWEECEWLRVVLALQQLLSPSVPLSGR